MRKYLYVTGFSFAIFCSLFLFETRGESIAGPANLGTEPGGDPASVHLAQSNPDEYAWQLFLFVNRQAKPGTAGEADPTKPIGSYDPDKDVVWETWALASGDGASQAGSEVYKPDGSDPGPWTKLVRTPGALTAKLLSVDNTRGAVRDFLRTQPAAGRLILIPPGDPTADNEVRMNEATYTFVRNNELYNVEGLQAMLGRARSATPTNRDQIQFPLAAKEIKADWIIEPNPTPQKLARYHWRKVGGKIYLLTGFHIITKDLKQWFWADFSHIDFETRTTSGGRVSEGFPSVDTTTRGATAPSRGTVDGERKELTGTKWAYYRLRGTQIDFTDAQGKPVIVGNTRIEFGFAKQSSCMTCHFNASIGDGSGGAHVPHLSGGRTVTGKPDATPFGAGNTITFLSSDFVWSAPFRAAHKAGP